MEINKVIIHCTDSDEDFGIQEIRRWHLERGFKDVGYHFLVRRWCIQVGRDLSTPGAHTRGENYDSIGIALTGKHHFYQSQFCMTKKLIKNIKVFRPDVKVFGHNYFNDKKTCPNFDIDVLL